MNNYYNITSMNMEDQKVYEIQLQSMHCILDYIRTLPIEVVKVNIMQTVELFKINSIDETDCKLDLKLNSPVSYTLLRIKDANSWISVA